MPHWASPADRFRSASAELRSQGKNDRQGRVMTIHHARARHASHARFARHSARSSRFGRTLGAALIGLLALAAVAFALHAARGMAAAAPAEEQEDDGSGLIISDFDDDGIDDVLLADPEGVGSGPGSPGEVNLSLSEGFDQTTEIAIIGESPGDRFGEAVFAFDLTANDLADFIIGAPFAMNERPDGSFVSDGAAFVFFSPLQPDANGLVSADDADLRLHSPFGDADALFGDRVAPLFDITGNGRPEIRVRSTVEPAFIDLIGGGTLTHIFAGADSDYADAGEFLFAIVTTAEFDPWQPLPGDVTGDGQVTQADIDIIIANLGMSGPDVTRFHGDLNGDGVVDALDLAIAMDNLGAHLIDVTWDADGVPSVLGGNGEELVVWRIPGNSVQGCLGSVGEGGLCCGCCGSPGFECRCCEDDDPGFGPCDTNPCDGDCPLRWCNPICDPGTPGAVQYGPCHPLCPGSECNPECDHFDPCNEECGEDDDGNAYGECHPDCEGSECNPVCEGADPCAEECEDFGGGPCGENCPDRFCNEECCDENDPDCDYGTCHEECDDRFCHEECCDENDPDCDYGTCHEECDDRFCHEECCDENDQDCDYGTCHEECDDRFCHEECCDENDPDCDYGACHEKCDDRFCHEECCDANDPDCDYGPCHPQCEDHKRCEPECLPICVCEENDPDCCDDDDPDPDPSEDAPTVCVGSERRFCAPSCPEDCEQDCESGPWQWIALPIGTVQWLGEDQNEGDCVEARFVSPGEIILIASNGCCTATLASITVIGIELTGFSIDPIWCIGTGCNVENHRTTAQVSITPAHMEPVFSIQGQTHGATIDSATGVVTPSGTASGTIIVRAACAEMPECYHERELLIRARPVAWAESWVEPGPHPQLAGVYSGKWKHRFTSSGGSLEDVQISETVETVVPNPFEIDHSVLPGEPEVWHLSTDGWMDVPDVYSSPRDWPLFHAKVWLPSPPNPGLPQTAVMNQWYHWWCQMDNIWSVFTGPGEIERTMNFDGNDITFIHAAYGQSVVQDYAGPPVLFDPQMNPPQIPADGVATSQGSVNVLPSWTSVGWAIVGDALGCNIDVIDGIVTAGNVPGTITIRISYLGDSTNYVETSLTLTAP
jgi:hypothetical protein